MYLKEPYIDETGKDPVSFLWTRGIGMGDKKTVTTVCTMENKKWAGLHVGRCVWKDDITLNYDMSQYKAKSYMNKLIYSVDETFSDDEVDFGICSSC